MLQVQFYLEAMILTMHYSEGTSMYYYLSSPCAIVCPVFICATQAVCELNLYGVTPDPSILQN